MYNRSGFGKSRPFIWSCVIQKGFFCTIYQTDTAPCVHYNDKSAVEINFTLEGQILQTHEGLLDQYHYRKGYHNILSLRRLFVGLISRRLAMDGLQGIVDGNGTTVSRALKPMCFS